MLSGTLQGGGACQVLATARFDATPPADIHEHLAQLGVPLTRKNASRAFIRSVRKPANVTAGRPTVHFTLRGVPVVYDVRKGEVACQGKVAPLKPIGSKVALRMLIDRGSIEVFGNDGQIALSAGVLLPPSQQTLALSAKGGDVAVSALTMNRLNSAWE